MRALAVVVVLTGCWSTVPTPAPRTSSPTASATPPSQTSATQTDTTATQTDTSATQTDTSATQTDTSAPRTDRPRPGTPSTIPVVKVNEPTVGPSPDKEIVRRYIHRNRKAIRGCYETALAKIPDLTGRLLVEFTIGGDGKVTATRASGLNPGVEACVASVIAAIEFPKPTGGAPLKISYPFVFQTTDDN